MSHKPFVARLPQNLLSVLRNRIDTPLVCLRVPALDEPLVSEFAEGARDVFETDAPVVGDTARRVGVLVESFEDDDAWFTTDQLAERLVHGYLLMQGYQSIIVL